MNRRYFFSRAGWAAAFLGGLGVFGSRSGSAASDAPAGLDMPNAVQDRLLDALPSRVHAAEIGKVHLSSLDERPDAQTLVTEISSCMGLSDAKLRQCSASNLRGVLRARTASDFAAGRTVHVGGWVLGATEARLFSLAALA